MGLRDRVKKVYRATETPYHTLILPDGEKITFTTADWFEALGCAVRDEEHFLVDAVTRADVWEGPLGLIRAMSSSHERRSDTEEEPH